MLKSPCLTCKRYKKDKNLCAEVCEKLKKYQDELDEVINNIAPIPAINTIEDYYTAYVNHDFSIRFLQEVRAI